MGKYVPDLENLLAQARSPVTPTPAAPTVAPKKKVSRAGTPTQPAFPLEDYTISNPWSSLVDQPLGTRGLVAEQPVQSPMDLKSPVRELSPGPTSYLSKESPLLAIGPADRISAENIFEPTDKSMLNEYFQPKEGMLPGQLTKPNVPNIPGHFAEHKLTNTKTESHLSNQSTFKTPEEIGAYADAIMNTTQFADLARRQKERDALALLALEKSPTPVDLSPLMALADAWTGSKFAQHYKAPISSDARTKALLDYADKAADDQRKIVEDINKSFLQYKTGSEQNKLLNTLAEMNANGAKIPRPQADRGGATDAYKVIAEGQKIAKDTQAKMSAIENAEQMLMSGDVGSIQRSLSIIARVVSGEKGVLTDQDITRVLPRTAGMDVAKLEAYLTSNPTVLMDKKVVDALIRDVRNAKKKAIEQGKTALQNYGSSVEAAPQFKGVPTREILKPHIDYLEGKDQSSLKTSGETQADKIMKLFGGSK